jgi:predicted helicase
LSGNGIKTERDHVTIHFTKKEIEQSVDDFKHLNDAQLRHKYGLGEDSRDWKVVNAKKDILENKEKNLISKILYRPFDFKFTWYSGRSKGFIGTPANSLMQHLIGCENIALIALRQSRRGESGAFLVGKGLINKDAVSLFDIGTIFPLYQNHPEEDGLGLGEGRTPNFNGEFLRYVSETLGLPQKKQLGLPQSVSPEDLLNYMYAIFYSPTYRKRYAEFLKIEFPRLPLTSNLKLFRALAKRGEKLVALHLLESDALEKLITEFPVKGDNIVEKVEYREKQHQVWINKTQYFAGVPKDVWEYYIGGYQVCERWLKDRKRRTLNYDDLKHYQRTVVALKETIKLMADIDTVIDEHGGWPIK